MKIALVSEHASPLAVIGGEDAGGQNVHVAALAAALVRRGHDVTVHTRRDDARLPERVRTPDGYVVHHVSAGPASPVVKDRLLPFMDDFGDVLVDEWADQLPDIAHSHFWMSGLATLRACQATGVAAVHTYHALGTVKRRHQGDADTSPPDRIALERRIGREATRVVATCSDEVAELREMGVRPSTVRVVPCGVDVDQFTPVGMGAAPGARPRIVVAGRLVPRKGVDLVIRALVELPGVELVVAGGDPSTPGKTAPEIRRLAAIAEECDVAERVRFCGPVSRSGMPALFRSADVVACTPWYEPFGIVPLEAMASGVPVVATAVGGMTDSIVDGVTGILVPPGDLDAFRGAVRRLLRDDLTRRRMGSAGRARALRHYSWDRVAASTEDVYDEVLGFGAAPTPARAGGAR